MMPGCSGDGPRKLYKTAYIKDILYFSKTCKLLENINGPPFIAKFHSIRINCTVQPTFLLILNEACSICQNSVHR